MTSVHVVGVGLDGAAGLTDSVRQIVAQATLLVGSDRHLSYFPDHPAERLQLGDLTQALNQIQQRLSVAKGVDSNTATEYSPIDQSLGIVILVSGDPLFFGLGRLLLTELPSDQLTFHPHLSAVQLAFTRIKVPWQDARLISAHGRSFDELIQALQQGTEKIAVLTDATNTPGAIARLLLSLDLPTHYQVWVCENLGGPEEKIRSLSPKILISQTFAPLNVVVLLRTSRTTTEAINLETLPLLGLPDQIFLSFTDRPGLMTKREVRVLALAELALQPGQIVWDIGAGTGSVSIEVARLISQGQVYAIEKTALGSSLIQQNCQRLQVKNVISIHGSAPHALQELPDPDRIFIGGSSGHLSEILDFCKTRLTPGGVLVLALATLEHLHAALNWISSHKWDSHLLQVQLSRSIPVAALTRWAPLNPVTLIKTIRPGS
jgi:precorrin-6Y C5,15-methyltransferase (decarboxylating)